LRSPTEISGFSFLDMVLRGLWRGPRISSPAEAAEAHLRGALAYLDPGSCAKKTNVPRWSFDMQINDTEDELGRAKTTSTEALKGGGRAWDKVTPKADVFVRANSRRATRTAVMARLKEERRHFVT